MKNEGFLKPMEGLFMFGMYILKKCVYCNQGTIIIHGFGEANMIVIMFD